MTSLQRGRACLPCRTRKVKCDGSKPSCGPCRRRGEDCQFAGELTHSEILEQQIDTLESRLEALENRSSSSSHSPLPLHLSSESYPLVDHWWTFDEPPAPLRQVLLDIFIPQSNTIGLFLDIPRFTASFNLSAPPGHPSRPSPALINVAYLWGIVLSRDQRLKPYEGIYLSRAVSYNNRALLDDHPRKEVHAIQTELLLSQYFFHGSHFTEGMARISTAVSIVTRCKYHQTRNMHHPVQQSTSADAVDEGEIINAFWATYIIDKKWATALNVPSAFPDESTEAGRVETPWPLDMAQYETGLLQQYGQRTVESFLDNPSESFANEDASFAAMIAKSAVLFQHATNLASEFNSQPYDDGFSVSYDRFVDFTKRVEKFYGTIAPVDSKITSVEGIRLLIAVRSLTLATMIALSSAREDLPRSWTEKCVNSAIATVSLFDNVDLDQLGYFNPFLGKVWLRAGEVILRETKSLAELRNPSTPPSPREEMLQQTIDRLITIMSSFAGMTPYIRSQCNVLQIARANMS